MDQGNWPQGAKAAVALTLDNCGEAADLNRGLWPKDKPVGSHYSITEALPQILALLKKYNICVTYFIEAWSLAHYGGVIANDVAGNSHEVAWHAWQHEAWSKLSAEEERENFERSFGDHGIGGFLSTGPCKGTVQPYRGFRPPGGIIHGNRTLALCRDYGLGYISPAAEHAALVDVERDGTTDSVVILPFRWKCVDAYYYMESFAGLRKLKGASSEDPLNENVLVESYIAAIDEAIRKGDFLSLLFHPFLSNSEPRLHAIEQVLQHLARRRDEGQIWLATCREIENYVRKNPSVVARDPEWDLASWR
ncbi:hypothetical protein M409DRAFT_70879 [Zasmidium cellare ATCC 36951]|uniref:NodB homology domain-containing protein n=1 Tax=Zasmidium cellare ATCC 36951 TaxID=1080233 RepID=A0A6A6BYK6_ZASCE|nr:uncharacterized protein M409DRAFT_70879 [Zasmidium cellare ATCC 36951]KAF2159703.1 hypothetical protein M409DRAFT_70879 [Zasmidium cellare ATCC 36951]